MDRWDHGSPSQWFYPFVAHRLWCSFLDDFLPSLEQKGWKGCTAVALSRADLIISWMAAGLWCCFVFFSPEYLIFTPTVIFLMMTNEGNTQLKSLIFVSKNTAQPQLTSHCALPLITILISFNCFFCPGVTAVWGNHSQNAQYIGSELGPVQPSAPIPTASSKLDNFIKKSFWSQDPGGNTRQTLDNFTEIRNYHSPIRAASTGSWRSTVWQADSRAAPKRPFLPPSSRQASFSILKKHTVSKQWYFPTTSHAAISPLNAVLKSYCFLQRDSRIANCFGVMCCRLMLQGAWWGDKEPGGATKIWVLYS